MDKTIVPIRKLLTLTSILSPLKKRKKPKLKKKPRPPPLDTPIPFLSLMTLILISLTNSPKILGRLSYHP